MSVLVVMEQRGGVWNKMSWETLAAGQQIAADLGTPVSAAVIGSGIERLAGELAGKKLELAYAVEHDALAEYTVEAFTAAAEALIRHVSPAVVLFPHTYQVRDFAPRVAARLDRSLASDAVGHKVDGGQVVFVRQLFQGKLNVDVRFTGEGVRMASIQAGAYRADQVESGSAQIENFQPQIDVKTIRTKPQEPFRESARAVDLGAADIIVSVGRGIQEKENIAMVEELAQALGAELAASRPICDNGWLPMERQVGSSGQTVSPKVYIAVGISGAIQHLVGMNLSSPGSIS
jgi:electron transfer flavoprotein alpha subunit